MAVIINIANDSAIISSSLVLSTRESGLECCYESVAVLVGGCGYNGLAVTFFAVDVKRTSAAQELLAGIAASGVVDLIADDVASRGGEVASLSPLKLPSAGCRECKSQAVERISVDAVDVGLIDRLVARDTTINDPGTSDPELKSQ